MSVRLRLILVCVLTVTLSGAALPASAAFTRNLHYGMLKNVQVMDLQDFLKAQGFYKGEVTGNYFSTTEKAVREFQNQEGIEPGSGYFGRKTRMKANELLLLSVANEASSTNASSTSSLDAASTTTSDGSDSSSTTSDSASNDPVQILIADLTAQVDDLLARVQSLESASTPSSPTSPTLTNPKPATTTPKTATTTSTKPAPVPAPATTTRTH